MSEIDTVKKMLIEKANGACQRISPLWPLKSFVAVNPYFGLRDQSFWQADNTLKRIAGVGLCMPRAYYQEQIASGRITRADLAAALSQLGSSWELAAFERALELATPKETLPLSLMSDVLDGLDRKDWSNFVVERISQYCAAYFDDGQAIWPMAWRGNSLYQGWLAYAGIDKSPWLMGLRGMGTACEALPATAEDAIVWALQKLGLPLAAVDDYLHAALLSVGGWAGWARYGRWQAELKGGSDDSLFELLAIRLVWDALLYQLCASQELEKRWNQSISTVAKPILIADNPQELDVVLQTAFEFGYQRQLLAALANSKKPPKSSVPAAAQVVFCIDVRSEVYRRSLEKVAPTVQTLGFAGFFGVLMEYLPFGAAKAKSHLPILFDPPYRISERPFDADAKEADELINQRHMRLRFANAWKSFKTSAASCFSFVEATGLLFAPKLLSDSMGWSRPVPEPAGKGLNKRVYERLGPVLSRATEGSKASDGVITGISETDRPAVAEFALRNMGMTQDFARLVLLVGHGSTNVNNPQATALDCGACAGQTGEASARIAAQLFNDPITRAGLAKEKGIIIPADTYFIAGLHDTTTDEVRLFNTETVPSSHNEDLTQLRQWLLLAGEMTGIERAINLGTDNLSATAISADLKRRARDWAQVRPEWALAGNAAFIVAPRSRTINCNLAGRSFLHDYDWNNDTDFATLQLIMTAPMVVGNWINMQYYGSVVDNRRFGSGNKVLHNVVGGSIGVLEGNGGDLRVGLAIQSLHDGKRWIHEPMRLNVVIEAPQSAIDQVIANHELVRELTENAWLHLFQIDADGCIYRRGTDKVWRLASTDPSNLEI